MHNLDDFVSSEVPDSTQDARLFDLVNRHNLHPRNHLETTYSRCNQKGECCYGFPHPLAASTTVDEFGRIHLRRRSAADAWVVSYCPALTRLMECHCHIDVCFTSNAFLYLYKYLFKGVDKTKFAIAETAPVDEFQDYLHARYLSAVEAVWRILAFEISVKWPAVASYSLHLPGRQLGQMARYGSEASMVTPLVIYLTRPVRDEWTDLKYLDFYERYEARPLMPRSSAPPSTVAVVSPPLQRTNTIVRRYAITIRRQPRVCRLHFVPLRAGELYYLRSLLLHRATYSFEGLRVVDGVTYGSFQAAATALGLFRDRDEIERAMEEAVAALFRPGQLRFLFANMLCDFAVGPLRLWEKFGDRMSEDFAQHTSQEAAKERALHALADILRGRGFSLEQVGLPCPEAVPSEVQSELDWFVDRLPQLRRACRVRRSKFNDEQAQVYDSLITACRSDLPQPPMFIDGKAGRGKTFLVECLTWYLRGRGDIVLITGTTALSVIGYERGRTAHSTFGIPVKENNAEFSCRIRPGSGQAKLICAAKLIIWDELPMANRAAVEAVDILLRQLKGNARPFGGILFLAVGDFRQVAPVVPGGGKTSILDSSIRASSLWASFRIFRLHQPMRNAGDVDFADWVDRIGDDVDRSGIVDIVQQPRSTDLDATRAWLYPSHVLRDAQLCAKRAYLTVLNVDVDAFNADILDRLPGDSSKS